MLPPIFGYSVKDVAPHTAAPPPEAFDACAGRAEGAACGFNAPHGRVIGARYPMGADRLWVPSVTPPPRQGLACRLRLGWRSVFFAAFRPFIVGIVVLTPVERPFTQFPDEAFHFTGQNTGALIHVIG